MSVERFFFTSESQQRLHAGPLGRAIDGFAAWLAIEGYARPSVAAKLRFVGNLSRWLEREELGVEALDEQRVAAFLACGLNRGKRGTATTGRQLLCYLRGSGVISGTVSRPRSDAPVKRVERAYERFLVDERGVSPATVTNYLPIVRAFLAENFGSHEVALECLGVRDANQFVLREARRLSRSRAKLVVTVLRSFLRHLYQRGDISADLSDALVAVRDWRLSGLPKVLAPEQIESMLDSCDRGTAIGQRDYAILLLLARLGLRAGEVVALTLDDFNWNAGIVTVPGKGKRREPLPLPRDAGEALTDYLRAGRPPCPTRRLFVRMHRAASGLPFVVSHLRHRAAGADARGDQLALQGSPSAAPLPGDSHAPQRGFARRHRANPAPPSSGDHPDLREGRSGCVACSRASLARRCGMTDLQQLLGEYLATRRALGVGLKLAGRLLQRFVAFAAETEAGFITTALALQWATEPRGVQPVQWATRLAIVRRFARFAHAADPRHEVPPPGLLSHRYRRSQPYLYSDGEIADLLRAAQGLSGATGLRPCTYATLLALLAVTGMRSSEPLRLNRDDVDLARHARR